MLSRLSDRLLNQLFWLLATIVSVSAVACYCRLEPEKPLWACLAISGGALAVVRHTIMRRFRKFLFKPIALSSLPRAARKFFQKQTTELEGVGFTQLGDFLLLPEPGVLQTRFFISSGRKCLVEISHWDEIHLCTFVSVAADGRYFETSSLAGNPPVGEDVPLDFMLLPGVNLLDMLQAHIDRVRDYETDSGVETLEIEPERFQDVINYGHRLAAHDCHQQGLLTTAPETEQAEETSSMAIA